ncbi:hypothetical protein DSECCO2_360460 [anaerobic digester metagenome]
MVQANGRTSIGTWTESWSVSFPSSTTITRRSAAAATHFSRVRAAPRPFMRRRPGSTWSAPSIAIARCGASFREARGIPSARARMAVWCDVGTPTQDSPFRILSASRSMAKRTVEPVPSPTAEPVLTRSAAAYPAALLGASSPIHEGSFQQGISHSR